MTHQEDIIVDIAPNRVKFFGTTGKMLLPSQASVLGVLAKLPPKKLVTIKLLCQPLAAQFQVEAVCPVTTKKMVMAIAENAGIFAPTWRVINQNGNLISNYPSGVQHQSFLLQQEGFEIETTGKALRVKDFKKNLMSM
jgi:hypothetical protein